MVLWPGSCGYFKIPTVHSRRPSEPRHVGAKIGQFSRAPRRIVHVNLNTAHLQFVTVGSPRLPAALKLTHGALAHRMPYPSASSSSSLLAKCGTTLTCVLRSVPLWAVVLVVLLLGALRRRIAQWWWWSAASVPPSDSPSPARRPEEKEEEEKEKKATPPTATGEHSQAGERGGK